MNIPRIFMIHFAGGSFYSYDFLKPYLKNFEIIPLELPGRGKRISENLITDFNLAAKDIYRQVKSFFQSNNYFMIYGHSMGAYLALKLTAMLSNERIYPVALIVSGNIGPQKFDENVCRRFQLEGELFLNSLRELGGIPDEILENYEAFNFFEPVLRSDFEVAERVTLEDFDIVNVPIAAIMGDKEDKVNQINNWKRFTTSSCRLYTLPGGHFFIYDNPNALAKIIKASFTSYL